MARYRYAHIFVGESQLLIPRVRPRYAPSYEPEPGIQPWTKITNAPPNANTNAKSRNSAAARNDGSYKRTRNVVGPKSPANVLVENGAKAIMTKKRSHSKG